MAASDTQHLHTDKLWHTKGRENQYLDNIIQHRSFIFKNNNFYLYHRDGKSDSTCSPFGLGQLGQATFRTRLRF